MEFKRLSKLAALALVLSIVPAAAGAAGPAADSTAEDPTLECDGEINDNVFCVARCWGGGYSFFILGAQTPCTA